MKNILLALFAIALITLGNSAGAGLIQNADRTGSPVSMGTCNNCHNGGSFGADPVIEIRDNGTAIDRYTPGQTYQVNLTINTTTTPSGYGFQLVGMDKDDNDGGSFGSNLPMGTRTIKVGPRTYFEQSRRLTENEFEIDWTAPAAGSGDIRFYAVGNAVNANGGTSGDIAATTSFTLSEATISSTFDQSLAKRISVYPVPVVDQLNIDLQDLNMDYNGASVVDMRGQEVFKSNDQSFDLAALASGTYMVMIRLGDETAVKRILKL